jgi:regulatory protein
VLTRRRGPSAESTAADDAEAAREAALRLLERTRRTRSDLVRRLRDKGFAPPVIEQVVERLATVGLVDDVEYARAWLAGRWGRRPAGWRRLEQELRARGVDRGDVAQARARLEQEQGAGDEVGAALRVITQAERRYRGLEPRVRRQRLYALLARRGFDGDTIEQALRGADRSREE